MGSFFHMGGYAAFIWPSFAASAVILVALLMISLRARKAARAELDAIDALDKERTGEAQT